MKKKLKGRPDNLFHPVAKDFGAHGRFDAIAHQQSAFLWLVKHRTGVRITILLLIIVIILLLV